nr:MAG TPA: hypothetical protein [Bacteriophage sp.]
MFNSITSSCRNFIFSCIFIIFILVNKRSLTFF